MADAFDAVVFGPPRQDFSLRCGIGGQQARTRLRRGDGIVAEDPRPDRRRHPVELLRVQGAVGQFLQEIARLQAPPFPGLKHPARQVGPAPQPAAADIAVFAEIVRTQHQPEHQLERVVGPVMLAPPAAADRDEGVSGDLALVGHEADEMPPDAVADMKDRQTGRRRRQRLQGRRHVQPPPVGVIHLHRRQILGPRSADSAIVIGQDHRPTRGHPTREPAVETARKPGPRRHQHRHPRLGGAKQRRLQRPAVAGLDDAILDPDRHGAPPASVSVLIEYGPCRISVASGQA